MFKWWFSIYLLKMVIYLEKMVIFYLPTWYIILKMHGELHPSSHGIAL